MTPLWVRLGDAGALAMVGQLVIVMLMFCSQLLVIPLSMAPLLFGGQTADLIVVGGSLLTFAVFMLLILAMAALGAVSIAHWVGCFVQIAGRVTDSNEKLVWLVVCAMGGPMGAAVYWFMKGRQLAIAEMGLIEEREF